MELVFGLILGILLGKITADVAKRSAASTNENPAPIEKEQVSEQVIWSAKIIDAIYDRVFKEKLEDVRDDELKTAFKELYLKDKHQADVLLDAYLITKDKRQTLKLVSDALKWAS